MRKRFVAAALGAVGALLPAMAMAGPVVDAIKARGELACGVRGDTLGFARKDAKGVFSGLDVDMCRAVAAALFGDAGKVKFTPLEADKRLDALKEGKVDMLATGTTYTLSRELSLGLDFPVVYFYDSQAFMTLRKGAKKNLKDNVGASVCVLRGTTTAENLRDWSATNKVNLKPVEFGSVDEMRKAFFAGKCELYTADRSAVYVTRQGYAEIPQEFIIYPEAISNEPLALLVQEKDKLFSEIVRWSVYALMMGEELGVTSRNVDELARSDNPTIKRFLGTTPGLGKLLGLDDKWVQAVIKQVGNYAEMYDRNVGANSQLKIPRALNSQWNVGGMLYSPPFR